MRGQSTEWRRENGSVGHGTVILNARHHVQSGRLFVANAASVDITKFLDFLNVTMVTGSNGMSLTRHCCGAGGTTTVTRIQDPAPKRPRGIPVTADGGARAALLVAGRPWFRVRRFAEACLDKR